MLVVIIEKYEFYDLKKSRSTQKKKTQVLLFYSNVIRLKWSHRMYMLKCK